MSAIKAVKVIRSKFHAKPQEKFCAFVRYIDTEWYPIKLVYNVRIAFIGKCAR